MNLTLQHDFLNEEGCFGFIVLPKYTLYTLERSYPDPDKFHVFTTKIPDGEYMCKRGPHRLHNMTHDFETFEITGVVGHTNLLFHSGNYNNDSDGCVLLGADRTLAPKPAMLLQSKKAFNEFMALQSNVYRFQLTVISNFK